jgi:hypothetical protein
MGGFQFQESHLEMVRPNVLMNEDDILPNQTNTNTMERVEQRYTIQRRSRDACVHIEGSYSPL